MPGCHRREFHPVTVELGGPKMVELLQVSDIAPPIAQTKICPTRRTQARSALFPMELGSRRSCFLACSISSESRFPRLTEVQDTKMDNAYTYTIEREDHTLGNMLRMLVLSFI